MIYKSVTKLSIVVVRMVVGNDFLKSQDEHIITMIWHDDVRGRNACIRNRKKFICHRPESKTAVSTHGIPDL